MSRVLCFALARFFAETDGRYHGGDMHALRERMGYEWMLSRLGHGCSAKTDGVWVDAIIVGKWCCAKTDGVCVDVIMVGTRMLWTKNENAENTR